MKALLDQGELEKMHDEFSMYFKGCSSKVRRSLAARLASEHFAETNLGQSA